MSLLSVSRFLSLFLMGLGAGVSLSHALQWPKKAAFPGDLFLRVQQNLYDNYGPAGAIMESGAFLATLATAYLVRHRPRAFSLGLLGLGCTVANTTIWATLINPINQRTLTWTADTLPPDWAEVRDRWHALHAVRLVGAVIGFGALILSVLDDASAGSRERAGSPSHETAALQRPGTTT